MDDELRRFDAIRPFEPEELPMAFDRLLADEQFVAVLGFAMPGIPMDALARKIRQCKTSLDFQINLCHGFVDRLIKEKCTDCDMDARALDRKGRYTFVSNHRDIVLDSTILDKLLIDADFETTCEIAIGDNLLAAPWIKDLVRINKSFIVERSARVKEMLACSKRLGEYMHYVIQKKRDNIWIAQREGRAKDSNDRTQPSILKMMAMGGDGSAVDRLRQLHIVPLSISYEYDPCDYLKAWEFQMRRDVEGWKKTKDDDVLSMKTGILGFKGRVRYRCAACIDGFLDTIDTDMPKGELFNAVARHIDREIHSNYVLYPVNYIAADLLKKRNTFDANYTAAEKDAFRKYVDSRVNLIDLQNKDDDFLHERIYTMYANPVFNHLAAIGKQID